MDLGILVLLTASFGIVLLLLQRSETKRRRTVFIFLLPVFLVIVWYSNSRAYHREALLGFVLAVVLNVLFWLFIGRYNPVGSSDSIRVLGLDD